MPAVSSRLAPRLKRVEPSAPDTPRLRWKVFRLPAARRTRGCRPSPRLRRVNTWMTPPMASLPYTADREPRSTSTRSIWSTLRNCRPLSPEVALAMRTPSTSTSVCAVLVPRMKRPGKLPRPPVGATCTPGTRLSRSMTLLGCRRSISARVNTVFAALVAVRDSTCRLALMSTSGSFRASSRSDASRGRGRQSRVARVGFFTGGTYLRSLRTPTQRSPAQKGPCPQSRHERKRSRQSQTPLGK